ncbi:MAG: alpha/beta fold hydrolase [Alphaproteobacteria bacterium]|nr:alpha/beta fold hydrolase [Alphaproteobacteria bacterium]
MTPSTPNAHLGPDAVRSVSPVTLPAPGRAVDLQMRISAPVTGSGLPVVLLSHGQGSSNHLSSLEGYAPLAKAFASRGFVVIQPTHLSSPTLKLDPTDPEAPLYWRSRALDMTRILDHLGAIEAAVPDLRGRLDADRVAVVGHSMGGHTASLLLGARLIDPQSSSEVDLRDARIRAGVVLAAPGRGGDALTEYVRERWPFFITMDFSTMSTPALVVAGDQDPSTFLTVMGPDWHADPYHLAPGPKSLLTVFGGEHGLGGISGWDVAETTDEDPARVAAVAALSAAWIRSQLYPGDPAWADACRALTTGPAAVGRVAFKPAA